MKFQVYSRRGIFGRQWYWRLRAGNNRVIAVGGEGFHNKADAIRATELLLEVPKMVEIEVDE